MAESASSSPSRASVAGEKLKKGPVMVLTVMPNGVPKLWKNLVLWFLYLVVVGIFVAYITGRAFPAGSAPGAVFRFAGVTAFIGYVVALWQMSIWYRRGWNLALKATLDGLIYAILTAGIFAAMWRR